MYISVRFLYTSLLPLRLIVCRLPEQSVYTYVVAPWTFPMTQYEHLFEIRFIAQLGHNINTPFRPVIHLCSISRENKIVLLDQFSVDQVFCLRRLNEGCRPNVAWFTDSIYVAGSIRGRRKLPLITSYVGQWLESPHPARDVFSRTPRAALTPVRRVPQAFGP